MKTWNTSEDNSAVLSTFPYTSNIVHPYRRPDAKSSIDEHAIIFTGSGTVKIGNLVMGVNELETCLRHLMTLTKVAKPEEFI